MTRVTELVVDLALSLVVGLLISGVCGWLFFLFLAVLGVHLSYLMGVVGFAGALIFVYTGSLSVDLASVRYSMGLFFLGSCFAWLAAQLAVGDFGSPYRGVVELTVTFAGGAVGVLSVRRRIRGSIEGARAATLVAFGLLTAAACVFAYLHPAYGYPGLVQASDGEHVAVRFLWLDDHARAVVWANTADPSWVEDAVVSGSLVLETDNGSGFSTTRVLPLDNESVSRYERIVREDMVDRVRADAREGVIPRLLAAMPYLRLDLDPTSVVLIETSRGKDRALRCSEKRWRAIARDVRAPPSRTPNRGTV